VRKEEKRAQSFFPHPLYFWGEKGKKENRGFREKRGGGKKAYVSISGKKKEEKPSPILGGKSGGSKRPTKIIKEKEEGDGALKTIHREKRGDGKRGILV